MRRRPTPLPPIVLDDTGVFAGGTALVAVLALLSAVVLHMDVGIARSLLQMLELGGW